MSLEISPALVPTFVASGLSAAVAAYAWRHRSERTAGAFVVLMLGLAWWAFAYGVELAHTGVAGTVLWDKLAFVGSVTVPAALFWLAVEYAGFESDLPRWAPAVLTVEPVVTLALVWTYPGSRLVWESFGVRQTATLTLPVVDFGAWYWANYLYSYVLIGSAIVLVAYVFVRGSRLYRRQAGLLLVGAVVPLGANLVYNVYPGLSPFPNVDLTTVAMALTGTLYGLALFRFKMLDVAPVARGKLLSEVGDGFAFVDSSGEVSETNDVGRRILDRVDRVGTPAGAGEALDGELLRVPLDGAEHSYEVRTEAVRDFRDERVGTLVLFRDITELAVLRRHEERLSVVNRILRHNIRNEMNVVRGFGRLLADALDGKQEEYAETIAGGAARMSAIGEKVRHVSTDLDASVNRRPVDVVPVVTEVLERTEADYPTASLSLDGPDAATAMVTAEGDLDTAVEYLVENALDHNDADEPVVEVEVAQSRNGVTIAVADDGPGIPPAERQVLTAGTETPLEHGSGLGLWIVHWLVTQSGGTLSFTENEPRGSVVTIELQAPR